MTSSSQSMMAIWTMVREQGSTEKWGQWKILYTVYAIPI